MFQNAIIILNFNLEIFQRLETYKPDVLFIKCYKKLLKFKIADSFIALTFFLPSSYLLLTSLLSTI